MRSESTSRLCLKNVVDKDNSCVTLNVAASAVCAVNTQCSAVDCGDLQVTVRYCV